MSEATVNVASDLKRYSQAINLLHDCEAEIKRLRNYDATHHGAIEADRLTSPLMLRLRRFLSSH